MADPTFDDLIPTPQAGAPQDGAVGFDDLIPNQGASWRPSSAGAGAVDFGDAAAPADPGRQGAWGAPSGEDGGTVIGPFRLGDPAAAGALNAAFGATGSPFTPTFHGNPVTPEAGVLRPDGTVAPDWAVLGASGSAGADFVPVAASRTSPDSSQLNQLWDWLGHQADGWFGQPSGPRSGAPNPASHAPWRLPANPGQQSPVPGSELAKALSQYHSLLQLQSPVPQPPANPSSPATKTLNPSSIDWSFIGQLGHEGGNQNYVYAVPDVGRFPNSGVTTAMGVDLHDKTPEILKSWGLTDSEIAPLIPYMDQNLIGQKAIDFVKAHPYENIPDGVLSKLNAGAGKSILDPLVNNFNNSNPTMNFTDLPPAAQTAIADVTYQWGPSGNLKKVFASGKFWDAITGNDWAGAVGALNSVSKRGAPSARRYADDAKLLQSVVSSNGTLEAGP